MLKLLKIKNFAIIDALEIEFQSGLNIISGETGAGKSIIMDALMLILGGRASAGLIRSGAEEATVEALFECGNDKKMQTVLSELGLPLEEEIIVRRIVQASGKNRIFVNGALVNTAVLAAVTQGLVDLCSQHDQQLLAKAEEQLNWIDRFGNLDSLAESVSALFQDWQKKKFALDELSQDANERIRKIDFLRFQLQELEEASLSSANEDKEIEQELKVLASAESLFQFSQEAESAIHGSESENENAAAMLETIGVLANKARTLQNADPKLQPLVELFTNLKVTLEETGLFLRDYTRGLSRNEERLEELNSRSAFLTKLKRKYGPALEDVLLTLSNIKKDLHILENHDASLASAQAEEIAAKERFMQIALELSEKRKKAAKKFAAAIEGELADLNMDRAKFQVEFTALDQPTSSGIDSARFLIAPNPGEPLQPMHKVASGGELSRVMLAAHNVVSSRGGVGVYLFDEVDAGIGGKTAVTVGGKIKRVAKNNQVICITHLPQVACFADAHFRVEKSVSKKAGQERTSCTVIPLPKNSDRVSELARMLGGMDNDKEALANAKAMLAKAHAQIQ